VVSLCPLPSCSLVAFFLSSQLATVAGICCRPKYCVAQRNYSSGYSPVSWPFLNSGNKILRIDRCVLSFELIDWAYWCLQTLVRRWWLCLSLSSYVHSNLHHCIFMFVFKLQYFIVTICDWHIDKGIDWLTDCTNRWNLCHNSIYSRFSR